jgi:uncharacterized membrane protein YagU involved in acid resistance
MKIVFKYIIFTALIAGLLDGIAAVVILGNMNFSGVWKFVASAFFGMDAFKGGNEMVIYGLLFHFFIALVWTIIYYYSFAKMKFFKSNKIIGGLLYGILIWLVMNILILPFTNVPKTPVTLAGVLKGISIIMICVGLPITLLLNLNTAYKK